MKHVCLLHEVHRANSNRKNIYLNGISYRSKKKEKYNIYKSINHIKNPPKKQALWGLYVTKKTKGTQFRTFVNGARGAEAVLNPQRRIRDKLIRIITYRNKQFRNERNMKDFIPFEHLWYNPNIRIYKASVFLKQICKQWYDLYY